MEKAVKGGHIHTRAPSDFEGGGPELFRLSVRGKNQPKDGKGRERV